MGMRSRWHGIALAAALAMLLGADAAQAQRNRKAPAIPPDLPPANPTGKVVGVRPMQILMVDDEQKRYLIHIVADHTKVVVTGTAEAEVLKSGMFVSFESELDSKGMGQAKIEKLTIFVPSEERPPGVYNNSDDPTQTSGPYVVRGRIRSLKRGQLQVQAGRDMIRVELAESPQIAVDMDDYSLAQENSTIEINGRLLRAGAGEQPSQVVADQVIIELAEPLTTGKRSRSRKRSHGDDSAATSSR